MSAPQFTLLIRNGIHECAPDHSIEKITVGALRKAAADMAELYEACGDALDTLDGLCLDLTEEDADRHAQRIGVIELATEQLRAALAKAVQQ